MIVGTGNILSPALGRQLVALQQTARSIDATQLQLSTGKRVNSALDNPQNFFQSLSLQNQASDLNRLLDGLSKTIRTIQVTENALNGVQDIVELAEFTAQEARLTLLAEQENISDVILAEDPIVYFQMNEESGTAIVGNSGTESTILGQYFGVTQKTGDLHFSRDTGSVYFDGIDDYINIPNSALINTDPAGYPERSVELTFNANTTEGRQVLFKAGGTGNAFNIYIEDGSIYFVARDAGDFGPFNISAEIKENTTYHAAFAFDSAAGRFTGYLNGEEVGSGVVTKEMNRHGGSISIGRSSVGSFYHDGPQTGTNNYFNGRISDFAIYNDVLTQDDFQARYAATQLGKAEELQKQVTDILSQVDSLIEDASYLGVNLLNNDNITSYFNRDGNSNLKIEGADFSYLGLGFEEPEFKTFDEIEDTLNDFIRSADKIRAFERSLAADLSIIESRQDYSFQTINTLKAGGDDLIIADQNEVGANLLALSTRQAIQVETLSLSSTGSNLADLLSQSAL